MEEGRAVSADSTAGILLRYLCLRRTARRSHCRYTIEICSRDVSGNLRSDSSFRDFYRDFQEIAETALDPRARMRKRNAEKSRGRGHTSEVRLIALLSLTDSRTNYRSRWKGRVSWLVIEFYPILEFWFRSLHWFIPFRSLMPPVPNVKFKSLRLPFWPDVTKKENRLYNVYVQIYIYSRAHSDSSTIEKIF